MNFSGIECPVCQKKFQQDDDVVVCPKCGAPYHRECYKEKGKCIYPTLHKNKQTWREVFHPNEEEIFEEQEPANQSVETVQCPLCGTENPKGTMICQNCGSFIPTKIKFGDDDDENENFIPPGIASPFSVFIDPMGGVVADKEFDDGVKGGELAKYVQVNTPYYLRIFAKIKETGKSRFNFSAFFIGGGWYLYRKQYLKGTIISIVMFLISFFDTYVSYYYSNDLFKRATEALTTSANDYVTYQQYISWAKGNLYAHEILLMFLPYLLNLLMWVILFACGFNANRGYYQYAVKKIKRIKESKKDGEDAAKDIAEAGGVNNPIAWVIFVCYVIMMIPTLFI